MLKRKMLSIISGAARCKILVLYNYKGIKYKIALIYQTSNWTFPIFYLH